ncbi:YbbR-like domain-containing protein [Polaribacter batillariae]|uniref:YbbR-like domain-containing protein n=1 Tax=Polaribacter batillariae TaxID=2808900 RepID=A0ABX7SVK8_9FLAO|nr:CdaR family protein [Polaribacter batillariae]QTD38285.1 YbbR-like domain-containing protein [Polaribacter batillariae]
MKSKSKIPKTFVGFLLASVLIWFLITLSKEYVTTLKFPIEYKEIAQNKLLQSAPVKEIDITIKASGFKILKSGFSGKPIEIKANNLLKKKNNIYYILTKNQLNNIQKQMPYGIVVQEILQDSLLLDLGTLTSKKIPLKPNLKLKYHVGYDLADDIIISPDSIVVSGPKKEIDRLTELELSPIELEDVKNDFKKEVTVLKPANNKNLKFSKTKAFVQGRVEQFTEGTIEVPYRITNLPSNIKITTLPKKVEVTFVASLTNFNKITEGSFQIECDYNVVKKNRLNYLLPKVISTSKFVKSFRIAPKKIDFLIQK